MTFPPQLSCEESLRRLDDYVDRNLSPEEQRLVQIHLRECLRCAREFSFEASLIEGLRIRLQRLSLPPRLLHSIRLRLRAELGAPRFDS